ncbi:hypothetical protein FEM48_Zijuj09G0185800 [Ziziphus jujuba var. spinosa]|uniref:RNase III domain-containing protein n=1 Tax=Ziziphus jujuba var. spinosa TaxID=714518 RepID=A0A978UUM3_ZIZJJ|nr:hypothetical protein FEM48_Zijuj09G0185800 [Ziziphus jujuba var. spinosa]
MAIDIKKVEEIIDYKFKNKKLLEEALTHPPGNTGSPSYERLEFLGDAVIGLAISKHFFWDEHYDLSPNDLTRLRSANVNNDKLARVAAHLGLYHHVQGTNISDSLEQAEKFEKEMREEKWLVYGREKGPKFLADIVESIAAAIYVDLNFDMQKLYPVCIFKVSPLLSICLSVYIDEEFIASKSSKLKKNARIYAADAALSVLRPKRETPVNDGGGDYETEGEDEEELHDQKKKWTKTIYRKRDEGLD